MRSVWPSTLASKIFHDVKFEATIVLVQLTYIKCIIFMLCPSVFWVFSTSILHSLYVVSSAVFRFGAFVLTVGAFGCGEVFIMAASDASPVLLYFFICRFCTL